MAMKFTPEQQRVIDTRDSNILVSAAAGSGKTAVLVERIIHMITEGSKAADRDGERPPIDIDRLLVVTFTQAAAAEMRERISAAIERKLAEQPENAHLQKQAALLHNAQITTIDSFCLFVLRNNFNDIGLDPGFRVADEGEIRLLQQDVLRDVLEEYFEKEEEDFYRLLESFSPSGSEKPLAEQILKVFAFSMSFPWPKEWLERCALEGYETLEQMERSGWMQAALRDCETVTADSLLMLERAALVCDSPDGPYMYGPVLETDAQYLHRVQECLSMILYGGESGREETGVLQALYEVLEKPDFARLPSKKDQSVSEAKREQIKKIRQGVKDSVMGMKERFFYQEPQDLLSGMQKSQENVRKLTELVLCFAKRFEEVKRDKNIIDFQDMEHMALQILVHRENGEDRPSGAAMQYRNYFAEVLIDEYQDSNLVQEALLKSVSKEEQGLYNRFMVGDVKQSIYKFRLARPELFLEKYESYSKEAGRKVRIDLHKNFRSRPEVLESVNLIFEKIMGSRLGSVEYDEEAALYPGAAYEPGKDGADYRTELLLFDAKDTVSADKKESEARMIASRMKELRETLQVTDKTGVMRPAAYRDMVILLRSNQGWDDVFMKVLKEEGIPVHAASKTGYFSATEIQTLLHFLRVIDNPLQDIALYGVLKSTLAGFTQKELALVKAAGTDTEQKNTESLYRLLCGYRGDAKIEEKAARFLDLLEHYRDMAVYTSIASLLQTILKETGYLYEIGALPGGQQRQANVEMLLTRAADFEQTSYYGLFHFIRYIEQMEKYNIDYGEANIMDENADTVRIMSIHKSKGLEFPICFVAGLAKRFNRMDTNRALLTDVDYGIGAECVDTKLRLAQTTVKKNALSRKLMLDAQGEELRVLYVAMTRAREKLILTGAIADVENKEQEAMLWQQKKGKKLPFLLLSEAGCCLNWILPAIAGEQAVDRRIFTKEALQEKEFVQTAAGELQRLRLQSGLGAGVDTALAERLRERFSFVYLHENLEELYTKTTVSELKKAGMEEETEAVSWFLEEEIIPYIPRFIEEKEEISATARGSAYHRVMELLAFADMPQEETAQRRWLEEQMDAKERTGQLTSVYRSSVNYKKTADFLKTELAGRMAEADRKGVLYREQPFVLGIEASRLKPQFPKEETVLVQGIIDVYFEEKDYLVVVDYKTDRVSKAGELLQRYQVQLDYYAEALQRLTGKPVREKIIYSFALGAALEC